MNYASEELLHPHQRHLVKLIVGAYERDHSSIYVSQTIGGTTIFGSAFETEVECQYGDIVALERAGAIDVVSYSDAGRISTLAPTPFASALTHPTDYVDLSDAAWTIARDTLHNQPERIRDVQRILRGICDAPDTPGPINETARAADLHLDGGPC